MQKQTTRNKQLVFYLVRSILAVQRMVTRPSKVLALGIIFWLKEAQPARGSHNKLEPPRPYGPDREANLASPSGPRRAPRRASAYAI